jgi:hypothetical protein
MQTWTEEEIKDLLLYTKQMQDDNEDLRAGIVLIQAKLDNEEAKVRTLTNMIKRFTIVNSQM